MLERAGLPLGPSSFELTVGCRAKPFQEVLMTKGETMQLRHPDRREALAAGAMALLPGLCSGEEPEKRFRLNYILSSAMYGYTKLEAILPEVRKTGAEAIDIWPKVHGNQREQIEAMGRERFAELLKEHRVKLGGIACYRLGPFHLQKEMQFATKINGPGVVLVCGVKKPKGKLPTGKALKEAIQHFLKEMKPHLAVAEKTGCIVAIENHKGNLIRTPESMRWLGEMIQSDHLGIALAPHHLPQNGKLIGKIAEDLGPRLRFFYAQQYGNGSTKKLPKSQELLQMPGRGKLDFTPIAKALKKIDYEGYTEIFMHPVPRGVPILDSTRAITEEINHSRKYLEKCLKG